MDDRHERAVPAATATSSARDGTAIPELVVPVIAEVVSVEKRVVDTGRGVRLHKRIHEELVPVTEPIRSTDYIVERVTVERPVDRHPDVRYEGDTMIVPVVAERIVTRVQLVVVEEIRLTRRETTTALREDVLVRREEVTVERFDETAPAAGAPPDRGA